ncbi:MAG: hypothetical protein AAF152_12100 [Cyanobacteria bacterium P01_A01_bin.114]
MPQLSMSLWLAAVQLALVPVTEAAISQNSIADGEQTHHKIILEQQLFCEAR